MLRTLHGVLVRLSIVCCVAALAPATGTAWAADAASPAPGAAPAPATTPAPPTAPALSLEQAVSNGLQYNPTVAEAYQNLNASRALVLQARSARSVTAKLQVVHSRVSEVPSITLPVPAPPPQLISFETVQFGRLQNTQGTLTIAKPLYTGGKIEAAVRQSRAGEMATDEQLRRTYQTVVERVKGAYYAVLVAADLVKVAQEAAAASREHLRVAQAHFDAGTAPRFDMLRAEAQVAQSEQTVIQTRNGLNLARAALDNAMGLPQGQEYNLTTVFASPQGEAAPLQTLIDQAEKARPEVTQIEAQIEAAAGAIALARSEKRPTLGVAWVYTRVLDTSVFQITSWTLGLQADLTIFNGKQTIAAVAHARSQQESARALLDQVRQGIALQVRQSYLDLNSARERIAAAAKGVTQAEEAFRIAQVRYTAGVSISVEVLDAQAALTVARVSYARAVYDYNVALAQLEFATGAWQPTELPAPQPLPAAEKPES